MPNIWDVGYPAWRAAYDARLERRRVRIERALRRGRAVREGRRGGWMARPWTLARWAEVFHWQEEGPPSPGACAEHIINRHRGFGWTFKVL